MKGFELQQQQLVSIVAALTADELARNFNRYTDFLSQSEWCTQTPLGEGGLELTEPEKQACAERCCTFFDQPADKLAIDPGDRFGNWAERLSPLIKCSLRNFRFLPATQAGAAQTRIAADEIYQDAQFVASLMHGRRRIVSMVSPHSLFGFITTIISPNLQYLPVIDGRAISPDNLADQLEFGDMLVATPTLWRYLIQTLEGFPDNIIGISFGEALTADLAADLRQKGLGAMRELYGSTETGIIAWRDSPVDPFILFDHWSGDEVSITRTRPDGQMRQMTAMDFLDWQSPHSFKLAGRRDGAVQIGAVNVFPLIIAKIIKQHEKVVDCHVRVAHRATILDQLIAQIILKEGVEPDEAMAWEIDQWCRQKLRPPERPRIYSFEGSLECEAS
ncbi:MAG: hypothetical protein ACWA5L_00395 [bacterium]